MNKLERAKIFRPQKGIEKYYEKGENESERGNFIRHPVLHILTYLASLLNFEHIVNSFIPLKSFYFLFTIFSLSKTQCYFYKNLYIFRVIAPIDLSFRPI